MDLRFKKKAFAFTFLTLFVSFLMFAFASFLLSPNNFNAEEAFTKARISQLSSEIEYFQDSYLPTATSYALFNTIDVLINYSINDSIYSSLNNNYSHFNALIYEGMTNASFDSNIQNKLINNSLTAILDSYEDEIEPLLNINFTYNIIEIIIYEKDPFFVTAQILLDFQIETTDNISAWDIAEVYEVSIPIYNFEDPEFIIYEDRSILIRPIAQFASNIDWDIDLLNETINQTYAVVYVEPEHDYTIGSSFLKRFLNVSAGSFKDVLLRYSFDLDEEEGPVYDYISQNEKGTLLADTVALINFNNESLEAYDLSGYNNSGIVFGATWDESNCAIGGCYDFDGIDDYVNISHNESFNFGNNSFSMNMWVNTDSSGSIQRILNKAGIINLDLLLNETNNIEFFLTPETYKVEKAISTNSWNMITFVINPNDLSYLYINGKNELELDTSTLTNFSNDGTFKFGGEGAFTFSGLIDEVSIYARGINALEVAQIYSNKKATFIEYEETIYEKGVSFDGIDDYMFSNSNIINTAQDNFSIELWFKPKEDSYNQTIFEIDLEGLSTDPVSFSLEKNLADNLSFKLKNSSEDIVLIGKTTGATLDVWHQVIFSVNASQIDLYLNGFLRERLFLTENITLGSQITFAKKSNQSEGYFKGLIDEFIVYNRTLDSDEVKNHFYNYRSSVKGCCNYVTLIDPNIFGYNDLSHIDNVSYSSKLFYDNYYRGIKQNVTIYNVTNLTSSSTSNKYFNFMLDLCLMDAYNVFSYNDTNQPAQLIQAGDYGSSCSGLVEAGIY